MNRVASRHQTAKLNMNEEVFDLSALSDRLFDENKLKPLAGKIRRAQELGSMHADLKMAEESLSAVEGLAPSSGAISVSSMIVANALINNALILYARATKTHSDERKTFDLRSRFTAEEAASHQELVDLRDKAVAHFGSGGSYVGVWQTEIVLLSVSSQGERVGFLSRRQAIDQKLISLASKQIGVAMALLRIERQLMLAEVSFELQKMAPDFFRTELAQHRLSMEAEFQFSPSAAAEILSSSSIGNDAQGVFTHGDLKKNK